MLVLLVDDADYSKSLQQFSGSSMSESNESVVSLFLDMIRCRDWYDLEF